jgi:TonB-dependent starch-binding outer membrane protein SusC
MKSFYQILRKSLLTFICLTLVLQSQSLIAQSNINITGSIKAVNETEGLPGVSIVIKGTSLGTITDIDGNYSISVPSSETVLVFSYIGYKTEEVIVGSQVVINLDMVTEGSILDEVVVVGYGGQKKLNLTGAVETVRFNDAVNLPVTNTGQLMYGRFSGIQLTQGSGLPGADASAVVIRGIGTFGNSTPLVVIDNIQYESLREFNNLAPSDVESISVLKDASASAIYGARGANGVIVVTTKKGEKGKFSIDYNTFTGVQRVTIVPEFLDGVNYARLRNERDRNVNGPNAPIRFSEDVINAIANGTDPERYGNTNWSEVALRDAPLQNHYLAFSGGNDNTVYRLSLGYINQEAIVQGKFKSDRYTLGLNLTTSPAKWLSVSNVTNAFWSKFQGPSGGANAITGETGIINQFQRSSPTIPVYYPNGEFAFVDGAYQNVNFSYPINHVLFEGNFGSHSNNNINLSERIGLTATIAKGLTLETSGSLNLNFADISNFTPTRETRDWSGAIIGQNVLNTLTNTLNFNYRLLNENILRYTTSFNKVHNFNVMAGHSLIYDKSDGFAGSLQGFPTDGIEEFNGGGVLNPSVSGGAEEEAWQSFFTRVNYNFSDRYLFEFNIRRDGSSKFGPQNRYGTFPSLSAGWNIHRESFMNGVSMISALKLRGSWGLSGNDRIGNYIYEQTYNTGLDYHIGTTTIIPAVALTSLANPTITWEKVEQYNIGLDLALLKNKIFFTADVFNRQSSDILYTNFPIPNSIGVTNLAAQNAAGMVNEGVEISINYRENIKDFKFEIGGNVTRMADNQVTDLGPGGEETIGGNSIIRIGQPFNAYFGYKMEGIFQSVEEVASAPKQFGSNLTKPGDIKFADLSGPEGVPDGIVNADDRVVIGNPFPRWIYNANTNISYKGIDMSVVVQGIGRIDRIMNANGQLPMVDDRNNSLAYWIDRWTPENPSTTLPRLGGVNNNVVSDFFIEDMSYLRLKNLELGYTLPVNLSKKAMMNRARIFVSGQNMLTFTKVKNFDPERQRGAGTDQNAPLYKVFSAGINLKF